MPLQILSGEGAVQIMPFRKLGGKCHFLLRFCTRNWSETYISIVLQLSWGGTASIVNEKTLKQLVWRKKIKILHVYLTWSTKTLKEDRSTRNYIFAILQSKERTEGPLTLDDNNVFLVIFSCRQVWTVTLVTIHNPFQKLCWRHVYCRQVRTGP